MMQIPFWKYIIWVKVNRRTFLGTIIVNDEWDDDNFLEITVCQKEALVAFFDVNIIHTSVGNHTNT